MTSSTPSKDPDAASVTSRTSGYVSGSNDDVGKVANQDALQSTFAKSQPINEREEDDYISPMNIQQDSSDTDESEASDDNDENIMNNDVISNDDVSDGQEIGLTRDAKKRIEAKIGTKQLYNTFAADDYSKLLTFEIDRKSQRAEMLKEQLHTLNEGKNQPVAAIARKEFQEIFDPEWTPERSDFHARKEKENTKKAAKKKGGSESVSQENIADVIPPERSPTTLLQKSMKSRENNPPMKMEKLVDMTQTDEWILARLATNQWQTLSTIPEIKEMNLEIERTEEKITAAETQLIELKAENKMVNTVAKNLRGEENTTRTSMKDKFRRQQSMIYQRLNPLQEYEIELAEFEKLLKQINGNLITEKECQFIFHVSIGVSVLKGWGV
ncbi:putative titin-like [Apostichopus japonicus]|uniref:Putative titin-like n=1 Tax=Stichopus japonicus TaxID=307972 RepID=A0A2G8JV88_STIJA|nr:putative titin-like [Apostichopus japonicus]